MLAMCWQPTCNMLPCRPHLPPLCRSPVLSSVNEAISGLATIRAFAIGPWLIERNRDLVDRNAATSLLNQSLNRWLSVRLEGLGESGGAALKCGRLRSTKRLHVCLLAWLSDGSSYSSWQAQMPAVVSSCTVLLVTRHSLCSSWCHKGSAP